MEVMFRRQGRCRECCEVLPEHRRHRLYCNPVCRAKSYRRWRFFPGLDPLNIVMATQLYRERPPPAPAAQPSVGRAQRRVYRVPTGTMTIDLTDLAVLDLPAPVRARLFAALSQLEALDAAERRVALQKAP